MPSNFLFARATMTAAFQRTILRMRRSISSSPGNQGSSSGGMVLMKAVWTIAGMPTWRRLARASSISMTYRARLAPSVATRLSSDSSHSAVSSGSASGSCWRKASKVMSPRCEGASRSPPTKRLLDLVSSRTPPSPGLGARGPRLDVDARPPRVGLEADPAHPRRLRRLPRLVEQLDRRLRGTGVDRDADVGLERDRDIALQDKRRLQPTQQPLGDETDVRRAVEVVEEGAQLVVAETGEGGGRAHQVLEPLGDLHHQPVAGVAPHPLLDGGDGSGQVDYHDRDRVYVPRPPVEGVLHTIVKEHPAREVGERIAEGRGREDVRVVLVGGDAADELPVLQAGQGQGAVGCELCDGARLRRGEGHGAEHRQLSEEGAAGPERDAEDRLLLGLLTEDQVLQGRRFGGSRVVSALTARAGCRRTKGLIIPVNVYRLGRPDLYSLLQRGAALGSSCRFCFRIFLERRAE